jgi:hypothetical protein
MKANDARMLPGSVAGEEHRTHGGERRDGRESHAVVCPPVALHEPEDDGAQDAPVEPAKGPAHPIQQERERGDTVLLAALAVAAAGTAVFLVAVSWLGVRRRRQRHIRG